MTDPKEGRGFDPDRMRVQFDRMWKQAMEGLDDLREVVIRASQTAKVKLDAAFLRRERDRLFQQLGEQVYQLIEEDRLRPTPEMRDVLDRIHALVEQLASEEAWEAEAEAAARATEEEEEVPAPKRAARRPASKKSTEPEDDA